MFLFLFVFSYLITYFFPSQYLTPTQLFNFQPRILQKLTQILKSQVVQNQFIIYKASINSIGSQIHSRMCIQLGKKIIKGYNKMRLKKIPCRSSQFIYFYIFIFITYFVAEGLIINAIFAMDNLEIIRTLQEEAKKNYGDTFVISFDREDYFTIFIVGITIYAIVIFMHVINAVAVFRGQMRHKYIPINIFSYGVFACWIIAGIYLRKYLTNPNVEDRKIYYNATIAGILIQFYNKMLEVGFELCQPQNQQKQTKQCNHKKQQSR